MKSFASKVCQRVSLISLAAILSISSLSAATPLFLSQVVNAAPALITDTNNSETYNTIQAAIDSPTTLAGDTISIPAGTYPESIVINKPLTIKGAGMSQTTLDSNSLYMVTIEASNVTIEGLTITSPNYAGNGGDPSGIVVEDLNHTPVQSTHITNVTIHDIANPNRAYDIGTQGINIGPGVNGVEIDHSEIYNIVDNNSTSSASAYGIQVWGNSPSESASNINIHDNNIYNISNPVWTDGISIASNSANVTVNNNIITGPFNDAGIYTSAGMAGGPVTITNNTVTGASANGILLNSPFTQTVTGNTVSGATVGIQVTTTATTAPIIKKNSISGNTTGLSNTSANVVDATNNWWGSATGPGSVGPGQGDNVSANVNYQPWCMTSDCSAFSSADAVTLAATGITSADATLNGSNGSYAATGHSFWVSTAPFSTNSSAIPSGVYSTPDMSSIAANGNFSAQLSSLTTDAIVSGGNHSTMPAIMPNTTYYYAAWSEVNGVWYPGQVLNFTTAQLTAPANLTLKTNPGNVTIAPNGYTNSYGITASWSPVTGADHYVYKYWNDISGNAYNATHPYIVDTHSLALSGTFNQGEGVHHIAVSACDAANNCSAESEFTVTYDHTPPAAPTITAPGARTWHNTTPIVDTWTAVTGDLSGINHYQIAYGYDDGHTFGGTNTCPGVTIPGYTAGFIGCRDVIGTERNHTPATSEQGGVTIWVRAIDNAGNVGPWSSSVNYHYDSTPATTTLAVSPLTNGVTGNQFTVSGDASDNLALNRVYIQLINKLTSVRYGGTTINLIPDGKTGHWTHDYNALSTGLPDGSYYAVATATDMAGNSTTTSSLEFTVDHTAPTVSIDPASSTGATPTITGKVNDPTATIAITIDGVVAAAHNNGNGTWTYTAPAALSDGSHNISVAATDTVGNVTNPVATAVITVTPPVTPTFNALTSQNNAPATPPAQATTTVVPTAAVLGDATTTPSTTTDSMAPSTSGVKGDSTQNNVAAATTTTSNLFGLAWYWWLIILAALLAIIWWIVAAARNRSTES